MEKQQLGIKQMENNIKTYYVQTHKYINTSINLKKKKILENNIDDTHICNRWYFFPISTMIISIFPFGFKKKRSKTENSVFVVIQKEIN